MTQYYQCPECGRLEQTQEEASLFCGDVGAVLVNPDPEPEFGYERMRPVKIVPIAPTLPEGVSYNAMTLKKSSYISAIFTLDGCLHQMRGNDVYGLRVDEQYILDCIERDMK